MPHSSQELIEAARREMEHRGQATEAVNRYALLVEWFQAESEFDSYGLRQSLLEIEGPAGIFPPIRPTLRGKLGWWVIRLQAGLLWWVVRALRLQGQALRAAYATIRQERESRTRLARARAQELAEIKLRLERIERQLDRPGKEQAES